MKALMPRIIVADVFDGLAQIETDSIDCVVTSPPYWGLRDYGVAGQIGMEPTLGEHLDVMVRVFDAVRRVLKPEGTLWINYGDCYATKPNGRSAAATKAQGTDDRTFRDKPFSTVGPIYDGSRDRGSRRGSHSTLNGSAPHEPAGRIAGGILKPKDLCMVPNRLAIALQEAGWWVRSEIIWGKPNSMPDSSGRYRPSTAHEKIFMLTKSAKAFYDSEAVYQGRAGNEDASSFRGGSYVNGQPGKRAVSGNKKPTGWAKDGQHTAIAHNQGERRKYEGAENGAGLMPPHKGLQEARDRCKQRGHSRRHAGFNDRWDAMTKAEQSAGGRLLRNYEPASLYVWRIATRPFAEAHFATFPPELAERCVIAGCPPGGNVLDPFGGAGTTGLVAAMLGHHATLIELNPDYARIARRRIAKALSGPIERMRIAAPEHTEQGALL